MNRFQVTGFVKDLRPLHTPGGGGGISVLSFTIKESAFSKDRSKHFAFWNAALFGKRAEAVANLLQEGMQVTLFGQMTQRIGEKDGQKRTYYNILGEDIQIPSRKEMEAAAPVASNAPSYETDDDDCPPF